MVQGTAGGFDEKATFGYIENFQHYYGEMQKRLAKLG